MCLYVYLYVSVYVSDVKITGCHGCVCELGLARFHRVCGEAMGSNPTPLAGLILDSFMYFVFPPPLLTLKDAHTAFRCVRGERHTPTAGGRTGETESARERQREMNR